MKEKYDAYFGRVEKEKFDKDVWLIRYKEQVESLKVRSEIFSLIYTLPIFLTNNNWFMYYVKMYLNSYVY